VGADHVGIAPDFVADVPVPVDVEFNEAVWPKDWNSKEWIYVKGFEDITQLPNVVKGLIERGWSTGELRKLLGENWLRVYEKVWGA
jgi:membrane dipeptidase